MCSLFHGLHLSFLNFYVGVFNSNSQGKLTNLSFKCSCYSKFYIELKFSISFPCVDNLP